MNTSKNALFKYPERFSSCRIAVLGDLMLDVYLWGKVSRISPEAPVPVVQVQRRNSCPGGAANVMRNLATLGAHACAFGVVGDDVSADELTGELQDAGVETCGIIRDLERRTTEKCRVIASGQQLLRADFEDKVAVKGTSREKLACGIIDKVEKHEVEAVIFEDYAKGVLNSDMLTEIIAAARRNHVITALDPKPGNLTPVKGLTFMKPNRAEAFAMAGITDDGDEVEAAEDEKLAEVARRLRETWEPDYLLISLAAQGMALYRKEDKYPCIIPTVAREVFDVSGAGDTVTATFTCACAAGASPEEAARIVNTAAGVVVGKVGTAPIHLSELQEALKGTQL